MRRKLQASSCGSHRRDPPEGRIQKTCSCPFRSTTIEIADLALTRISPGFGFPFLVLCIAVAALLSCSARANEEGTENADALLIAKKKAAEEATRKVAKAAWIAAGRPGTVPGNAASDAPPASPGTKNSKGPALVGPDPRSGLVLAADHEDSGSFAQYSGETWIKGRLAAEWVRGPDSTEEDTRNIRLIPEESVLTELPHFQGYIAREISLDNEAEALKLAFSPAQIAQFERRELKFMQASGEFLLHGYTVGVECNTPWARTELAKVKLPVDLALSGSWGHRGCW